RRVAGEGNGGAGQRGGLSDQGGLGPGALQKRLGDKKAEPEPKQRRFVSFRATGSGPAMGDIGRAEAVDHFRSKAGPIIADGDADLLRRPAGGDLDPAVSKIHRIFDEVAETVTDC